MKKHILIALGGGAVILSVGLYFGRSSASTLHKAAKYGNAELIIKLIQEGSNINQPNLEGQTPLMLAAQADHNALAVTKLLLTQGAQVNEVDQYGNTALIYAAQAGDLSVVKELIEHGADAAIKNKSGAKAVDFSMGDEHFFVTQYLESLE